MPWPHPTIAANNTRLAIGAVDGFDGGGPAMLPTHTSVISAAPTQ